MLYSRYFESRSGPFQIRQPGAPSTGAACCSRTPRAERGFCSREAPRSPNKPGSQIIAAICRLFIFAAGAGVMAEWLRREPENLVGFTCVGSNPTDAVFGVDPVAAVSSRPRWTSYVIRDVLTVEAPLAHLSQDERDALVAGVVTLLDFHHDNISRYTLVFSNENCIYFQLERYQWTLRDLLDEHRRTRQPIALGVTFSVLLGVTKALEYFHSKNIIHCHVAPELIVLDNGICLAGYELHLINRHKERDTRVDIWGLAAVVYELSTLQELQLPRHPIQRTLDKALSQLDKISDPQLRAFLRQMLTLDHISVKELIEPLEKHLQSHPEHAWYPTLDELGSKWLSPTNGTIKSIHQSLSFTRAEATTMFPDLHAAISAFVHHGSRWVRQYAVAVLAHIEEAGDGRAILSLLETKHNGKYILTTERAALIHPFAEKEGDRLLDSGYTRGYIRTLAGLPTADLEVQPDGWNSWFRYAEQMLRRRAQPAGARASRGARSVWPPGRRWVSKRVLGSSPYIVR
ncbi:hypothetical protein QR46_4832 [Giardia duodenalis assemblage B]|uniref:Protein kinase domain-containing protein n=1 Tax=Giardia duodenalis assemblage B TaxID=1394984 RepID=A0A132NMB0_GIAIN|nr:hypothetical protein QR46_4832 [Giardia intestinalis assemblage B]